MHAWMRTLTLALTANNDGYSCPFMHTIAGIVLNSAWARFSSIFSPTGMSQRNVLLALVAATLLPFCLSIRSSSGQTSRRQLRAARHLVLLVKPANRWMRSAAASGSRRRCFGARVAQPWRHGVRHRRNADSCLVRRAKTQGCNRAGMRALVVALLGPWMAWQKIVQRPATPW